MLPGFLFGQAKTRIAQLPVTNRIINNIAAKQHAELPGGLIQYPVFSFGFLQAAAVAQYELHVQRLGGALLGLGSSAGGKKAG